MPPPELSGSFPHMTIRASDVTFFDFRNYLPFRNSPPHHLADAHHLRAVAVVELKNDRIAFATVNTWVLQQIRDKVGSHPYLVSFSCLPHAIQVYAFVCDIMRLGVLTVALLALTVRACFSGLSLLGIELGNSLALATF